MKLRTKTFTVTDAAGNEIDLDGIPVELHQNGQKTGILLDEVFTGYKEFDDGEIYGQSLLSFFQVKEDGKLYFENNYLELVTEFGPVKVVSIERPSTNDDKNIDLQSIKEFSHKFGISHPDKLFADLLSDEDKQHFVTERANAQAKEQPTEDPTVAAERQRLEEETNADAALRAQVDPKQLHTEKGYKDIKSYYKDKKCLEYIAHPYHVFFGPDEEPCLLIKRGKDWWQEPTQTALDGETEKEIIIQFDDLGTDKEVLFNTETGEIKLKG